MSLQDLGAVSSMLNAVGVGAILIYIVQRFESGRYVRGEDLEDCRRETARLHRLIERRLGVGALEALEAEPQVMNGGPHD